MRKICADVAVIGAGSAGLRAFRAASKWAEHVVLIEGGPYGTTCARVGCMPSKLLIAAAEAAHASVMAPHFGIRTGPIDVDGVAVMQRVRAERDRFVGFVVEDTEAIPDEQRIRGYAKFLSDTLLQIGDHTIVDAARIVIATGSSPYIPSILYGAGDRLIVNDDIFDWVGLPRSVAVVGSGVIGLELGQALGRLGVEVQILGQNGTVGPITDPVVREAAREAIADDVAIDTCSRINSVTQLDSEVEIRYETGDGQDRTIHVEYVIAATGRRPNVDSLRLENTSLKLDEKGVPVFDSATMRAGEFGIFLAGDVVDDRVVLHEAADEGSIAGENAARYPTVRAFRRSTPLGIVFSDPQIGLVGERLADLDENYVVGEASFENQGRSRVMLANKGIARIYADSRTGRFLGAEIVGPRAEHLAHLLAWARQNGMTIERMLDMPFYHPVIEEGIRTALRDAAAKLKPSVTKVA